ncbi:MAG: lipopolysaccharide heptosyltransferase II [Candidatus Aminicenantes bacterium]|nr:lipopolysaccharide heptosyltransferase II [Candidatus Aminicenantes bacterium]
MGIVIRSPNWIGDGIMGLPALRALRAHFPGEFLAMAAKRYLADIYLNVPEIDEIIPLPDRWSASSFLSCARDLGSRRFERGVLFTNSFSSALLFRLAGIRSSGYARDGRGWLLHDRVAASDDHGHHQHYYLRIVEHLTGSRIERSFPAVLSVSDGERERAAAWLRGQGIPPGTPLLAVSPTAAYGSSKAWLPGRFRELIGRWLKGHPGSAVLLPGSPSEREGISAVAEGLPGRILNLAGRLSLRQAIAVLAHCRLFIGNDSGLMHIAAALDLPLVAVFGPTEPGRTAPLAARFRLLYHRADCAPCRHRECPTDHRCMASVAVDEVLAAADGLWGTET